MFKNEFILMIVGITLFSLFSIGTAFGQKIHEKPWIINIASFTNREKAHAFTRRLKEAGYNAHMGEFDVKGQHWYRVSVGFFATKGEAKIIEKKLSSLYDVKNAWIGKYKTTINLSHVNIPEDKGEIVDSHVVSGSKRSVIIIGERHDLERVTDIINELKTEEGTPIMVLYYEFDRDIITTEIKYDMRIRP